MFNAYFRSITCKILTFLILLIFQSNETLEATINTENFFSIKIMNCNESELSNYNPSNISKTSNKVFHSKITFNDKDFDSIEGVVNFECSVFCEEVSFNGIKFTQGVDFTGAIFKNRVDFSNVEFCEGVDFSNVVFKDEVLFTATNFHKEVLFCGSYINHATFHNAVMPDELDLSKVNIEGYLDLLYVRSRNKGTYCKIDLVFTEIDKIKLMYNVFKINLPDYDNINNLDLQSTVYQKLLSNLKNDGHILSYEKLDKEFKEFNYLNKKHTTSNWFMKQYWHFVNWLDKIWWEYGYNQANILIITFILFSIFSFVNVWSLSALSKNVYKKTDVSEILNDTKDKKVKQYLLRIPLSIYYTSLIFFVVGFKTENFVFFKSYAQYKRRPKHKRRCVWYIFMFTSIGIMYVSGLVCIGYLANFILSNGA